MFSTNKQRHQRATNAAISAKAAAKIAATACGLLSPGARDKRLVEQAFKVALRATAANMLRVIRGAGKPRDLLYQMGEAVNAAVKLQDLTGSLPVDLLTEVLQAPDEAQQIWERRHRGEIDEETFARWKANGTIDEKYAEELIKAGVLQIIASRLLHQDLQVRAGERELSDGLNKALAAREQFRKYYAAKYAKPTRPARRTKSKKAMSRTFGSKL